MPEKRQNENMGKLIGKILSILVIMIVLTILGSYFFENAQHIYYLATARQLSTPEDLNEKRALKAHGVLVPDNATLVSPLTKQPCVYYHYKVTDHSFEDVSETILDETKAVPTHLKTVAGDLPIYLDRVVLKLNANSEHYEYRRPNGFTESLLRPHEPVLLLIYATKQGQNKQWTTIVTNLSEFRLFIRYILRELSLIPLLLWLLAAVWPKFFVVFYFPFIKNWVEKHRTDRVKLDEPEGDERTNS